MENGCFNNFVLMVIKVGLAALVALILWSLPVQSGATPDAPDAPDTTELTKSLTTLTAASHPVSHWDVCKWSNVVLHDESVWFVVSGGHLNAWGHSYSNCRALFLYFEVSDICWLVEVENPANYVHYEC